MPAFSSALRATATLAGCLLTTALASAQQSYPMLMSLKPVAVQAGATVSCEVQSRYTMAGAHQVLVTGGHVSAEVVPPPEPKAGEKPKDVTKLELKFTVAPEAQPGVREFRVVTPQGVSTVGQLVIVRDPVIGEAKDNDVREKAQEVTLPAALAGTLEKNEDFDFFKFKVEAGSAWTFHVRAQRLEDKIHDLQTHIDPILFLRDAAGGVLAMSDNANFADPFLEHRFEQAGEYVLEIRDVRYQGNPFWDYCIEVSNRPFVTGVHPLAVTRGQESSLELSGFLLPADPRAPVTVSAETPVGPRELLLSVNGQSTDPVMAFVTDLPRVVETDAPNDAPETAVKLDAWPAVCCGRIEKEADLDCYSFAAKKGERISLEVLGRRFGSRIDSFLRILNEKGQAVREDDDLRIGSQTSSDTWLENWTVPADGTYTVEIRDVHLRGGANFEYALSITRSEPYFQLLVDTDKTQLSPGLFNVIFVRALKKNGFDEEITLHVDGLPPGVTATTGRILKGKSTDGVIVLTAVADAPLSAANITIRGTATLPAPMEGQAAVELATVAQPQEEIYLPGGGRGHWPVDSHVVCVGAPADIRGFQLSETDIRLKPGESKTIAVKLDRAEGVNANITLDMLCRHLGSIYGNSLPEGVSIDAGASKTLLTGKNSAGSIVLKADASAPPCERQVCAVMANFAINFVMKATYSGPPVFVSVEKKPE